MFIVFRVIQVHGSESDIDALCIGPFFASIAVSFSVSFNDLNYLFPRKFEIVL